MFVCYSELVNCPSEHCECSFVVQLVLTCCSACSHLLFSLFSLVLQLVSSHFLPSPHTCLLPPPPLQCLTRCVLSLTPLPPPHTCSSAPIPCQRRHQRSSAPGSIISASHLSYPYRLCRYSYWPRSPSRRRHASSKTNFQPPRHHP